MEQTTQTVKKFCCTCEHRGVISHADFKDNPRYNGSPHAWCPKQSKGEGGYTPRKGSCPTWSARS